MLRAERSLTFGSHPVAEIRPLWRELLAITSYEELLIVTEHLIRIRRSFRNGSRVFPDLFAEILYGCIQLRVTSGKCTVREVIDLDIRINSVAFDQPFSFRSINSSLGGGGNPSVRQRVVGGKPYLASPGPYTNDLAQSEPPNSFGKGFSVGCGQAIAKHYDVSAKCVIDLCINNAMI